MPFANAAVESTTPIKVRRMTILLFRKTNQLVHEWDTALHWRRRVARANNRGRRSSNATVADDVEISRVRKSFRRQERRTVRDLKMHVRLSRVAGIPQERNHLPALDVIADLHPQRPRPHMRVQCVASVTDVD